ncbi:MAG: hypothetical protein KF799_04870 [Bdellovibrionales bacterium]|nr:hypothetical protein [Bdellovibrionales bacterium]
MKRSLLILVTVVLVVPAMAQAQQDWNVRSSPLALLIGLVTLRVDYRLADHWVIGPEVAAIDRTVSNVELKATGLGVVAMYYFDAALSSSAFIEFGASSSKVKLKWRNLDQSSEFTNSGGRILAGYHWFWDRLNLSLGAGLSSNSAGDIEARDTNGNVVDHYELRPISLALDCTLGWAF